MVFTTLSAYETSAEEFFNHLEQQRVDLVLDARLKNTNQLAGFTKKNDLDYFVGRIIHARYSHDKLFAPAPTMFERYLNGNIDWDAYSCAYRNEMSERRAIPQFFERYGEFESVALVGTGTRARRSHTDVLKLLLDSYDKNDKG